MGRGIMADLIGIAAVITSLATLVASIKTFFQTKKVHEDVKIVAKGINGAVDKLNEKTGVHRRNTDQVRTDE
jgi:hypothetical protein